MSDFRIDQITNQAGTAGPQIAGITTFSNTSGLLMPLGPTEYRGGRGRGVWGGGYNPTILNTIDYITISTTGNAFDFGDLSQSRFNHSACSSSIRGLFSGGYTPTPANASLNVIDYVTISSTGHAFDFGDISIARYALGSVSNSVRGIFGGGNTKPLYSNLIEYVTISSLGNASVFGDLSLERSYPSSCSSNIRGIFGGGTTTPGSVNSNVIDYITISTTGTAQDFGDLTLTRRGGAGCSSNVRGLFGGGNNTAGTSLNTIDYITIASLGDAIDFGDLTSAKVFYGTSACSSQTRGLWAGGASPYTTAIDFVTIATIGNASSFGNLTQARQGLAACSDAHGGLGD